MAIQTRNAEDVDLKTPDFPHIQEASYQIGNIVSNYKMIPGLRGFWPMSSVNELGQPIDYSEQNRTLSNAGPTPFALKALLSCATFNGATQYFHRADEAGLDITGPLAFGGWFYLNALAGTQACITKWNVAAQRAYFLASVGGGVIRAAISTDGAASVSADSAGGAITAGAWYCLGGRFIPNTEVSVFVNLTKVSNVAGIPATIFNSNADFMIAGHSAAASLAGKGTLCWISAAPVEDVYFNHLFEQSKALFNY